MAFLGKPKLIWYWTDRGFGSELIYTLNALLYAEKHHYEFNLISCYSNFSTGIGWNEYFNSFAKEKKIPYPFFRLFYSVYEVGIFNFLFTIQIKLLYGIFAKTNPGIWRHLYNKQFEQEVYSCPTYGIENVSCYEALHLLLKKILIPNDELKEILDREKEKYQLKEDSFAVHLRHGDKVSGVYKESDAVQNDFLYEHMNSLSLNFSQLYVLSDDHQKFKEFATLCNDKEILTHCEASQRGYSNYDFIRMPASVRKKEIITLLLSIDAAVNARYFIGPYTSNVSKVIYLLRNGVGCYNSELTPFKIYN
jgi:hypothetical protein